MGTYRIEIQAVGGHGCQRKKQDISELCDNPRCPDCLTKRFVRDLKQDNNVEQALIIHWPQQGTIVDNLLTDTRTGSF